MKKILTIGYAATAISPYYSEEQHVRKKSEEHLRDHWADEKRSSKA